MAWISVYQEVDGPKLRKLAKLLETSKAEALGILNFLWFWGMNNADETGRVLEAGREDIEDAIAGVSRVGPKAIVDALFTAGWLDAVEGDIFIHDWDTWQEQWYKLQKTRKYNAERMRRNRSEDRAARGRQEAPEGEDVSEPPPPPQDGLQAPVLDGAFAIRDVYLALLEPMRRLDRNALRPLSSAGSTGVGMAYCGGEARSRQERQYVAVDGIDNVIQMLEEIEDGRLPEADFIELRACTEGCVGGCLNVENPFTAKMRLKQLMDELPEARTSYHSGTPVENILETAQRPEFLPTYLLDSDRRKALEKMFRIQELEEQLPGLRCGSCGAPSCRAFAEDVVMGRASEEDCIFKVRERMQHMAGGADADEYLPAPFRRRKSAAKEPPAPPEG